MRPHLASALDAFARWIVPGLVLALVVGGGVTTLSCSQSSSGTSAGSGPPFASGTPPQGADVDPSASVTLQPNVVVIRGGASVIQSLSSDHGVWTLDKAATGVSGLAPGKIALIAGVDCARVTAIQDNGSTVDVTVAPVAFTDVLQEANFQWQNAAIDMTKGYIGQLPYALVVDDEATDGGSDAGDDGGADASDAGCGTATDAGDGGITCLVRTEALRPQGIGDNPTNSLTLSIGNWTVSGSVASSGSAVDLSATCTWMPNSQNPRMPNDPAQTLSGINASLTLAVHVQNVQGSSGSVVVHGGTLSSASLNAPIGGSADLTTQVSAPTGSQFPAQALLKLPFAAEFPLPAVAGLPLYLSLQANLLLQPSIAARNGLIKMSNHVDVSGNAGLSFSGGSANVTAAPNVTTPQNPINMATTPPSVGTTAVVVAIQAPRVGVGIGTMAFGAGVKAGFFVDAVNAFTLTVASETALVPCRAATWDFGSHGGGEMSIALLGSQTTITHQIDLKTAQDPGFWYSPMVAACKP
jgi:hypothetical protein